VLSIGKTPGKRTTWPAKDGYLTKETPWIKNILEKKDTSSPTNPKATAQATNSGSQKNSASQNPKK
jgi:hypothetical protein